MNLAVIFGGKSDEHEVSRNSAVNVLTALEERGHDILVVGITKAGRWYATKASHEEIANGEWEKRADNRQAVIPADPVAHGFLISTRPITQSFIESTASSRCFTATTARTEIFRACSNWRRFRTADREFALRPMPWINP